MARDKILVVDDDPQVGRLVTLILEEDGFEVLHASSGEEALKVVAEHDPELVVLDIVLPGLDGYEVLRRVRANANVPVMFLSARDAEDERVRGLESGADDYLTKPFNSDELAARVRAILRRARRGAPSAGIVRFGTIELDLERRLMRDRGAVVVLSRTEWMLLEHLVRNAGKVVLSTELLEQLWGPAYRNDFSYLRVWISRLRRKLGAPRGRKGPISTVTGVGYRMTLEPADDVPPAFAATASAPAGGRAARVPS